MNTQSRKKQSEHALALQARKASQALTLLTTAKKNRVLKEVAAALLKNTSAILQANNLDVSLAKKNGITGAFLDRLVLTAKSIAGMAAGVREIAALPDPVGEVAEQVERNGLSINRVRIPLGVICMIYEARPNVTIDAASLCFKSGNAVILRGGSEACHSNRVLAQIFCHTLKKNGIDPAAVSPLPTTDRMALVRLLALNKLIDVVIPRGGPGLMAFIAKNTRIPVIKHDKGVCSLFVDATAKIRESIAVIENAKVQRPGVCNALETLYVHKKIARRFLPVLCATLGEKGVEIRGDAFTKKLVPWVKKAKDKDWAEEYLDLILAIKVVNDVHDAIKHVQAYSSDHTDGILTGSIANATLFARAVNSSCVTINASTRFNDGGQLGLGAEIGIATTRLHAYGPMGLKSLTTLKFVVTSEYGVRQ